jgi:hypothetical protein
VEGEVNLYVVVLVDSKVDEREDGLGVAVVARVPVLRERVRDVAS